MNIEEKANMLEGNAVQVARGPAAAMVASRRWTGGGLLGANSSHPLEIQPIGWPR